MLKNLIPVILCGGNGSRLWPLSSESFPKQFWPLIFNSKHSLLQNTFLRIEDLPNLGEPIFITNEKYKFLVLEHLQKINIHSFKIIVEKEPKNTAPAIALAALQAISNEEDPFLLVLSADHYIRDKSAFQEVIKTSLMNIENDFIYTFGVSPTFPETGYGYIEICKKELNLKKNFINVKKFIEKPNEIEAKSLMKSGNFLWNAGIFIFKAKLILQELQKYEPKIYENSLQALSKKQTDEFFIRVDKQFLKCPSKSIDIAILEKSDKVKVIPLNIEWSDIGNWEKIWEYSNQDSNNNVIIGEENTILEKSKNSYLYSQDKLTIGIGLNNITVVNTKNALLVLNRKFNDSLKDVVKNLKKRGIEERTKFEKDYRPWGSHTTLNKGERWKVKEIEVKPNCKLSLQSHLHRSEHWIVVQGTALVEIDNKKKLVKENESIYIPIGSKHRLSNPGKTNMHLIEVQTGQHLKEKDIIRYEDNYGR